MANKKPVVLVGTWPPRPCGIATFAEEALEFIQKHEPDRPCYVISHTDGEGENVFPLIDLKRADWYEPVVAKIRELDPYAVHLEHEYGIWDHVDGEGRSDMNEGFLRLLAALEDVPTIVEPHTVHGRLMEHEISFVRRVSELCNVLLFKCHYQKWRLQWQFSSRGWDEFPRNIMIVPHGARPDRRYGIEEVDDLKEELGLGHLRGRHILGLVGWIQSNKRWDILMSMWEDINRVIEEATGQDWVLLAAGDMRDPHDKERYERWVEDLKLLEHKDLGSYYKFTPRGEPYYKVMAVCDFIVLPSLDETQSGTLARIIALNKPYITTAPLEGLTAQTLESGGGLLFTTKKMLRETIIRLAMDEGLRWELGHKLYRYLLDVVSWDVVAGQYYEAYEMANFEVHRGIAVDIPPEF